MVNIDVGWSAGACAGHHTAAACLKSREGTRCAWANDKICMTPDMAQQRLDNKNIETVSAPQCAEHGKLSTSLFRSYVDSQAFIM